MRKLNKATKPAGILAATVAGVSLGSAIPAVKPGKPAPVAVAPVATDTAAPAAPVAGKPTVERFGGFTLGNINRTAATVVALRTNFGGVTSDRDTAYLAAFERVRRDTEATPDGETITLASLAKLVKNPYYTGSAKPHDAGAINRAVKAGNVERAADGHSIKLTARGATLAATAYNKLHGNG
jgi:hypothetical protein